MDASGDPMVLEGETASRSRGPTQHEHHNGRILANLAPQTIPHLPRRLLPPRRQPQYNCNRNQHPPKQHRILQLPRVDVPPHCWHRRSGSGHLLFLVRPTQVPPLHKNNVQHCRFLHHPARLLGNDRYPDPEIWLSPCLGGLAISSLLRSIRLSLVFLFPNHDLRSHAKRKRVSVFQSI